MPGNIQGKITIRGGDQARGEFKKTKQSAQEMTTAGKDIAQIAGAAAGVGLSLAALTAAAEQAARAIHSIARAGGEFSQVVAAMERLGSPALAARLNEVTGGLGNTMTIMRETNQVLSAHIIEEDLWVRSLGAAAHAAQAMGEPLDRIVGLLSTAASGGGIEGFVALGVNIFAVRREVEALGLRMESTAGRAATLRLVTEQMESQYGSGAVSVSNYDEAVAHIESTWHDYKLALGRALAEDDRAIGLVQDLENAMVDLLPDVRDTATAIVDAAAAIRSMTSDLGAMVGPAVAAWEAIEPLRRALAAIQSVGISEIRRLAYAADVAAGTEAAREARMQAIRDRPREGIGEGQSVFGGSAWAGEPMDPFDAELQAMGYGEVSRAEPGRRRRGGGGGGGPGDYTPGYSTAMDPMLAELAIAAEESRTRAVKARLQIVQDEAEALQLQQETMEGIAAVGEKRLRALEEERSLEFEIVSAQAEAAQAQRDKAVAGRESAIATAEAAAGAFDMLGGVMQQIIAQQEAAGESAETTKKWYGGFLIAYNAVMAATEIAKAIGSYPDPVGIIAHAAAAAAHVSAAVIAATQLGGGSASSASAAVPASTFAPAELPAAPSGPSRDGVTITNQYLLSDSEAGLARSIERATWRRQRQHRVTRSVAVRYGA